MSRQSVLLLTSHHLDWRAVRNALRDDDAIDLTEVTTLGEALRVAALGRLDAVVLPATFEGSSTVELIRAIRSHHSLESQIVVLGSAMNEPEFAEFLALGVAGLLIWDDLDEENYLDYLRTIIHGRATVFSPQAGQLWKEIQRSRICLLGEPVRLTQRDLAILRHLYAGLSRHEIAEAVGVSDRTVKRGIERLMEKLDAHHQFILGAKSALLGIVP